MSKKTGRSSTRLPFENLISETITESEEPWV